MRYRTIDHTADLGLEIFGESPAALFENACLALFDTMCDLSCVREAHEQTLRVDGCDQTDLLINWLRELLALWTVEDKLIASVHVLSISETAVFAQLKYDRFQPKCHQMKREVKAITYHRAQVVERDGGWVARVVVDV